VIDYLKHYDEVDIFIGQAFDMIQQSISVYTERHFTNLSVSFGCTGGQHRSVYCAEQLARGLKNFKNIELVLRHREQE
jgi:RNase adaptor protein for sRNA GlmZ degradation